MRLAAFAVLAFLTSGPALAAEAITSAYTDIDLEKGCTTFASAPEDEGGDWANTTCNGYRGYPVLIYYGDARESVFYGFPPDGDIAPVWESFDAFNSAGPKIEWRIATESGRAIPFATIHRWKVSDPEDPEKQVEVLVVAKVGQPQVREGCAVGYVVSTGNPNANEKARRIADTTVRDFVCGADQPSIDQGSVPVPSFSRQVP